MIWYVLGALPPLILAYLIMRRQDKRRAQARICTWCDAGNPTAYWVKSGDSETYMCRPCVGLPL